LKGLEAWRLEARTLAVCVDVENVVVFSLKHLNQECTKPSPGNLGGETGLASCAQRSKTAAALPPAAVHSTLEIYPPKKHSLDA